MISPVFKELLEEIMAYTSNVEVVIVDNLNHPAIAQPSGAPVAQAILESTPLVAG